MENKKGRQKTTERQKCSFFPFSLFCFSHFLKTLSEKAKICRGSIAGYRHLHLYTHH